MQINQNIYINKKNIDIDAIILVKTTFIFIYNMNIFLYMIYISTTTFKKLITEKVCQLKKSLINHMFIYKEWWLENDFLKINMFEC
jgi:hypothetical protein